jgi:carbohydrate-binding DOMON domain-containing protein
MYFRSEYVLDRQHMLITPLSHSAFFYNQDVNEHNTLLGRIRSAFLYNVTLSAADIQARYLAGSGATSCEGTTTTTITTATTTTTTSTTTQHSRTCNGVFDPIICTGRRCTEDGVPESCPALCGRCNQATTSAATTTISVADSGAAAQVNNNTSSSGPGWILFAVVCALAVVLGFVAIVVATRRGGSNNAPNDASRPVGGSFANPICEL